MRAPLAAESPAIPRLAAGLFLRSPVKNPTSKSSMFTIAGNTIYFRSLNSPDWITKAVKIE
jgi:hypothetical protein